MGLCCASAAPCAPSRGVAWQRAGCFSSILAHAGQRTPGDRPTCACVASCIHAAGNCRELIPGLLPRDRGPRPAASRRRGRGRVPQPPGGHSPSPRAPAPTGPRPAPPARPGRPPRRQPRRPARQPDPPPPRVRQGPRVPRARPAGAPRRAARRPPLDAGAAVRRQAPPRVPLASGPAPAPGVPGVRPPLLGLGAGVELERHGFRAAAPAPPGRAPVRLVRRRAPHGRRDAPARHRRVRPALWLPAPRGGLPARGLRHVCAVVVRRQGPRALVRGQAAVLAHPLGDRRGRRRRRRLPPGRLLPRAAGAAPQPRAPADGRLRGRAGAHAPRAGRGRGARLGRGPRVRRGPRGRRPRGAPRRPAAPLPPHPPPGPVRGRAPHAGGVGAHRRGRGAGPPAVLPAVHVVPRPGRARRARPRVLCRRRRQDPDQGHLHHREHRGHVRPHGLPGPAPLRRPRLVHRPRLPRRPRDVVRGPPPGGVPPGRGRGRGAAGARHRLRRRLVLPAPAPRQPHPAGEPRGRPQAPPPRPPRPPGGPARDGRRRPAPVPHPPQGLLDIHSVTDNLFGDGPSRFPLRACTTALVNCTNGVLAMSPARPARGAGGDPRGGERPAGVTPPSSEEGGGGASSSSAGAHAGWAAAAAGD